MSSVCRSTHNCSQNTEFGKFSAKVRCL